VTGRLIDDQRAAPAAIFDAALAAAHPRQCLVPHLPARPSQGHLERPGKGPASTNRPLRRPKSSVLMRAPASMTTIRQNFSGDWAISSLPGPTRTNVNDCRIFLIR
jgi:glycerate-2-kinase